MELKETEVEGTLKPDGTLELDERPNLPPGRVKVVLRQVAGSTPHSLGPEFFRMMEEIWAGQRARGHAPRTAEDVEAERGHVRGQLDDEIEAAIRLQEECRLRRKAAGSETIPP